jgi:hypothetical protein
VFLFVPNSQSHRYRVRVSANSTSHLTVRPSLNACLYLGKTWAGLMSCDDEGKMASLFAQEWTGSDQAIVLRSGEHDNRPTITGSMYRGGEEQRVAWLFADGNLDEAGKLAAFLVGGIEAAGISVEKNDRASVAEEDIPDAGPPLWSELVLGTGYLAMHASAIVYFVTDNGPTAAKPNDKTPRAVWAFTGSVMVTGVGVYGWLSGARYTRRAPAALFAFSTTAILTGAAFIVADEAPQAPDRHTAPLGIKLAGAGVGLAAVGYLVHRWGGGRPARTARATTARTGLLDRGVPMVSATRDGVMFGWAGNL